MIRRSNSESDKFELGMDYTIKRARDRYEYDIKFQKKMLSYHINNRKYLIKMSKFYDDIFNKAWYESINQCHILEICKIRAMKEDNGLHRFSFINKVRSLSDMVLLHNRANNDDWDEDNSTFYHQTKLSKMQSRIIIHNRRHK